jgi:hypothetical protein
VYPNDEKKERKKGECVEKIIVTLIDKLIHARRPYLKPMSSKYSESLMHINPRVSTVLSSK